MSTTPLKIARSIFETLKSEFPHLYMEIEEAPEYTEIELTIPAQDGLDHEVALNLQNIDELHFNVDDFWGEWFPCTDSKIAEGFLQAVRGFLSGRYRVVVYSRKGKSYKRLLQSPVEDSWNTEYTHTSVHWPGFSPQVRYVQNGSTT
ncbi:hypothetical protein OOT55_14330 [Marinimicrobium sp. C6131]|uniref:hypothetical protein n=1 Tax=Marinimicrobium sp. C6131 TaxID=3022676 RepID=UPI00223E60A9|nr:hypothetical protein [Marinimicrobium sp. C6131]UZJ43825.1 hypothetical protein OOT55_14330 [Marinimicrobium sp. C6131]